MRNKGIFPSLAIMIIFGLLGLTRFGENIRAVQVVGLFGSGMATGAGLMSLISILRSKQQ
jgi:hypothetical protein